jgi:DNA-binding response OmpR family regulator
MERVWGLEVGADDYITKPFSMNELKARIRAMVRRMSMNQQRESHGEPVPEVIDHGFLMIHPVRREARLNGVPLNLTPKEFEVLSILAREPGRVFSRAFLLKRIWGTTYEGYDRTVDTHVFQIRKKLRPYHDTIKTVWGSGYKFGTDENDGINDSIHLQHE